MRVVWRPPYWVLPHMVWSRERVMVAVEDSTAFHQVLLARVMPPYVAVTPPSSTAIPRPSICLVLVPDDQRPVPRLSDICISAWAKYIWRKLAMASGESVLIRVRPSTVTLTYCWRHCQAPFLTVSEGATSRTSKPS